jgi:hypothetical protein
MSRIAHLFIIGLLVPMSGFSQDISAETSARASPLAPEQLRAIRSIGRSVLQARVRFVEEPETQQARETIASLREAIDQELRSAPAPVRNDAPPSALEHQREERSPEPAAGLDLAKRADKFSQLRTQTEEQVLREDDQLKRDQARTRVATYRRLEEELQLATKATGSDRFERLTRLRDRLSPHRRPDNDEGAPSTSRARDVPTFSSRTEVQ